MNDMELSKEEQEGVDAIIYLQKMNNIDEPFERALKNWRLFSEWDKENTLTCYRLFKK